MGDLVARLRDKFCCENGCNCDEAADRIEALEAEVARLTEAKAAPAVAYWRGKAERAEAALTAERAGADALAARLRTHQPPLVARTDAQKADVAALSAHDARRKGGV